MGPSIILNNDAPKAKGRNRLTHFKSSLKWYIPYRSVAYAKSSQANFSRRNYRIGRTVLFLTLGLRTLAITLPPFCGGSPLEYQLYIIPRLLLPLVEPSFLPHPHLAQIPTFSLAHSKPLPTAFQSKVASSVSNSRRTRNLGKQITRWKRSKCRSLFVKINFMAYNQPFHLDTFQTYVGRYVPVPCEFETDDSIHVEKLTFHCVADIHTSFPFLLFSGSLLFPVPLEYNKFFRTSCSPFTFFQHWSRLPSPTVSLSRHLLFPPGRFGRMQRLTS